MTLFSQSLGQSHFWISDPSEIWSARCLDKKTTWPKDKKAKKTKKKDKTTKGQKKRQKDKDQKESLILWCQGTLALLHSCQVFYIWAPHRCQLYCHKHHHVKKERESKINFQHHTSFCPGDNNGRWGEKRSCARRWNQWGQKYFAKLLLNSNPRSILVLSADILLNKMSHLNMFWHLTGKLQRNESHWCTESCEKYWCKQQWLIIIVGSSWLH